MNLGAIRRSFPLPRALRAIAGAAALAVLVPRPPAGAAPAAQPGPPAAVQPPAPVSAARIEFPVSSHDFGSVHKGEPLRYDFKVLNTGDAPLEIADVHPSCGCTTAGDWTHRIEAGGAGTIPIRMETAQFTGPVTKTITVTSNDPVRPKTVLEINATIWTPVQISEPVVIFPALTHLDQVVSRSVTIRNQVAGDLKLTDLRSDQPQFRPTLRETVPGREFELTITTVPPLTDGTRTARITMKSSNPTMPDLAVQVVATVLPAVQVAPTEIVLTTARLAAPEKKYVVVLNHRGAELKLSELKTNLAGVGISTAAAPDGSQFTVTLTFPAGFEVPAAGKMFFSGKTNLPALPAFEVPIVYAGNR